MVGDAKKERPEDSYNLKLPQASLILVVYSVIDPNTYEFVRQTEVYC